MKLQKAADISTELRQRRPSRTSVTFQPADDTISRKISVTGSRKSISDRSMAFSDDSDSGSGTDYNDDDVCVVKKDPGFRRVKGQEGMYFKVVVVFSSFVFICLQMLFYSYLVVY